MVIFILRQQATKVNVFQLPEAMFLRSVMLLQTSVQEALDLVISEPVDPTRLDLYKGCVILADLLVKPFEVEFRFLDH
jgi:hypothetical protein